jgi:hypothetical protein
MDDVAEGYFSLLRWRANPTRDEARNVAVLVVTSGEGGALRAAPLSSISPRLQDQGILDDVLRGLEQRLSNGGATIEALGDLHRTFEHALVVTEPQPVALRGAVEDTVAALYRAYVAPRGGGSRRRTKGVVLDRVVDTLRSQGVDARRGQYVGDFIFDVVIEPEATPTVVEVLSFAAERKNWTPIEQDAAHFLYGLRLLREEREIEGRAVVEPPGDGESGAQTHERVLRWFEHDGVPRYSPEELADHQGVLEVGEPAGRGSSS